MANKTYTCTWAYPIKAVGDQTHFSNYILTIVSASPAAAQSNDNAIKKVGADATNDNKKGKEKENKKKDESKEKDPKKDSNEKAKPNEDKDEKNDIKAGKQEKADLKEWKTQCDQATKETPSKQGAFKRFSNIIRRNVSASQRSKKSEKKVKKDKENSAKSLSAKKTQRKTVPDRAVRFFRVFSFIAGERRG